MSCPRCQRESTMDVDLYFGYRQVLDYELGDECEWWPEEATVEKGGRPPGGNLDGVGYAECPLCKRDFFVIVSVRGDRIVGVQPNPSKKGYIPD